MKEDKFVAETIKVFCSDLRGKTTDEFYEEYVKVCNEHGVKPKAKTIVMRLAKKQSGCEIYSRSKLIVTKFFESSDYSGY